MPTTRDTTTRTLETTPAGIALARVALCRAVMLSTESVGDALISLTEMEPLTSAEKASAASKVTGAWLDYSSGQAPRSTVKPAHRPLHSQVTALLVEREHILERLNRHQCDTHGIARSMSAGLRLDRDDLRRQLDHAARDRSRLRKEVVRLQHETEALLTEKDELAAEADQLRLTTADLGQRLQEAQDALRDQGADVARLSRAAIDERRHYTKDVPALRQELASAHEETRASHAELKEARRDRQELGERLKRVLEERQHLKQGLDTECKEKERALSQLNTEQNLNAANRRKLDQANALIDTLKGDHSRLLSEHQAAGSLKLAELEATHAADERHHDIAFVRACQERASWRRAALDEQGRAQAAAARLDGICAFLEEAATILRDGAHIVGQMRGGTHNSAECDELIQRTWQAVANAGRQAMLEVEANPVAAGPTSMQRLLAAVSRHTTASVEFARNAAPVGATMLEAPDLIKAERRSKDPDLQHEQARRSVHFEV